MRQPRTIMAGDSSHASKTPVIEFSFANTFPLVLMPLAVGDFIREVYVEITQPFSAGVALTLGFPANHQELLASTEIDPQQVGQYQALASRKIAVSETMTLYLTGTAAVGQGRVVVEFGGAA